MHAPDWKKMKIETRWLLAATYLTVCSLFTALMLAVLEIKGGEKFLWGVMFMIVFTVLPIAMHSLPLEQGPDEHVDDRCTGRGRCRKG